MENGIPFLIAPSCGERAEAFRGAGCANVHHEYAGVFCKCVILEQGTALLYNCPMHKISAAAFCITAAIVFLPSVALANNVAVANVSLQNINTGAHTVQIKFDLSQSNAFGDLSVDNQAFSDYIWIVVKFGTNAISLPTYGYQHATLAAGGTITPTSDYKGAFVKASTATTNMTVVWNYGADSVSDNAIVNVKVLALETVKVPTGQFTYDAGGIGGSTYNNFGGGAQTDVTSAASIPSGGAAGWPNGYNSFYLAKYEVSQGQWADFLNMLSTANAALLFANENGANGNTVTYTAGNAYGNQYAATAVNRSNNWFQWTDATAYASWLAMCPMTEMEFEKAARGTNINGSNTNLYPWGNADPGSTTYTYNDGTGNATYMEYYADWNNLGKQRPVDVGHYLRGNVTRTNAQTGASPYGITDLAGNDWETVINCASAAVPANGAGVLSPVPASWPSATAGSGIRGGNWYGTATYLRVSDRTYAGYAATTRTYDIGFRPARTP